MYDLTVITPTHVQARWILTELDRMATWEKMVFKPKKSRSLVIQKGKTTGWFKLLVQGEVIPNIQGNPVRCLGKWYDESLSDKNSISSTRKQVEEWLKKIDKYGLPGKNKCWIYQHGLLRDSCGFSLVYEVLLSTVEEMERKFNKHLRRWLGIPPSFTSLGFYIRSGQLQLPLSSVVEEFKVAKCRLALTYRDLETNSPGKQESEENLAVSGPPAQQLTRHNVLLGPKTSSETLAMKDRVLEKHISSSGQSPPRGRREP